MASTKFYLDLRGKAADGKGSILIQIFHNHSMTSVSTGIRVLPTEWDGTQVVKISGAEAINASLGEKKGKLNRAIAMLSLDDRFNYMTAAQIKAEIFNSKPKRTSGHYIIDLFNEFTSSSDLSDGTKSIYKSTLKKVIGFAGEGFKIEQLNLKWIKDFDRYLAKSQGINGKAIYLRHFRAVCNYASKTGIEFYYPFNAFQIKQEVTRKRNISVDALREFYSFKTDAKNSYYRDYFFLMFYLIGINSVDLLTAKKSQVVNGRLEYIRKKTGKPYSIKIEPEAQILLDRYAGQSDLLLEATEHCLKYQHFNHQINDALKLIGPKVKEEVYDTDDLFAEPRMVERINPIIPGCSSYFARHTWATLAYEAGISLDIISQALGHSFGNRTTLIYIKTDPVKVDEANRKVLDYFFGLSCNK